MVRAEVKKKGTDTVLGNVWWVLDPLITMLVYVLVMTVIFERSTPDFPLVPARGDGALQVVHGDGRQLDGRGHGPRAPHQADPLPQGHPAGHRGALADRQLPLRDARARRRAPASPTPDHLTINLALAAAHRGRPVHLPSSGFTFLVSSITVFYRDVGIVIGHLMRLLFWVSPILWSFHAAAGRGAGAPEAIGETGFALLARTTRSRCCSTPTGPSSTAASTRGPKGELVWTTPTAPDLPVLAIVFAIGVVITVIGVIIFKRLEPAFAKVL